jgi:hypothetical protein
MGRMVVRRSPGLEAEEAGERHRIQPGINICQDSVFRCLEGIIPSGLVFAKQTGRNMRSLFASFLILTAGCSASPSKEPHTMDDMIIYYLSFDVETFLPVGVDTIEKEADCRFVVAIDSDVAGKLNALFSRELRGQFNNEVVRVKVIGPSDDPIFVDRDGGILRGTREGRLTSTAFDDLRSMLDEMGHRQGCLP